ncbi:Ku protein [Streptomyces sp. NPDC015125]|uniref:non-homologous end joining protein Ku n=1 Tax=Streptomyces sp. NPDC015125 TaxID=3364938 RepID=UPI0036FBCC8A
MNVTPPSPPKAAWTGVIAFSLIIVPIRLYRATEERSVRLREIHKADSGKLQHRRFCEKDGLEIPYDQVGRGYELADTIVPLSQEELDRLPLPTRHQVQVLGFVPAHEIDPIRFTTAYYAGPDGQAAGRPYTLLTTVLSRSDALAVCRVAIRTRERLAVLQPRHGVLTLHLLLWPDEVRDPGALAPSTPVTEREVELAELLMSEFTGVASDDLHDRYREALEALVDAKVTDRQVEAPTQPQPTSNLLAALEESVQAARKPR